jgi:hypothetical protein
MGKFGRTIYEALASKNKIITKIALFLFLYVVVYYFYLGITTTPEIVNESDSLGYHLPIAREIAKGNLLPPKIGLGLGYYPASAEVILALFIKFGIPLNLFNLLGLVLLFVILAKLGQAFGLGVSTFVFAVSVSTLNSVLRLVSTQTVDIWLVFFFFLSLYFLQNLQKNLGHFIKLGTALGFLIGAKYSGPFYAIVLLFMYRKKLLQSCDSKKLIGLLTPIGMFGLFWYLRNFWLTENPFYPGKLLNFPHDPNCLIQNWSPLKTIFLFENGGRLFIQSLISEYLFWPVAFLLAFYLMALVYMNKVEIKSKVVTLMKLGVACFFVYLFSPSWPINMVSDLRYLFPSIMSMVLVTFVVARKYKLEKELGLLALLSSFSVLAQLSYRPKLVVFWLLICMVVIVGSARKVNT